MQIILKPYFKLSWSNRRYPILLPRPVHPLLRGSDDMLLRTPAVNGYIYTHTYICTQGWAMHQWMNEWTDTSLRYSTATEECISNDIFRHSLYDSPASYLTELPSPSLNTVELIVIQYTQLSLRTQFKVATVYSIHTQSLLHHIKLKMSVYHLANAWRSRLKHILQWWYYTDTTMEYGPQNQSYNEVPVFKETCYYYSLQYWSQLLYITTKFTITNISIR